MATGKGGTTVSSGSAVIERQDPPLRKPSLKESGPDLGGLRLIV